MKNISSNYAEVEHSLQSQLADLQVRLDASQDIGTGLQAELTIWSIQLGKSKEEATQLRSQLQEALQVRSMRMHLLF